MKIDIFKSSHAALPVGLVVVIAIVLVDSQDAFAAANPYETITTRNVFGIKPPAPPAPVEQPKPQAPEIKLQGLTTILGNKLVLFKARIPARPPEIPQPKDMSFMLSEGQRDGEIEVLEINDLTGIVKFRNYGVEQTLSLRENADKPVAVVAPIAVPVPGVPVIPAPGSVLTSATLPSGSSVTTFGGNNMTRSIPTRNPRTGNLPQGGGIGVGTYPGAGTSQPAQQQNSMSPEVQAIMIEAHRALADPAEAAKLPITVVTPRGQPTPGAAP